ncbi:serine/threonine-protein kinase [Sandaracinus amylolyticus]|uniref:Serine/threonine protein kinase n=1 Tax=Sandaracinus amylolyticus TaxID=927083 RepID=A0A0F6VZK2_9BACT|nr:serine/threonine-protein kinase [Sandaracinus amylolyticus]AKF03617.1 serine/threonine protein kinase [Sandaracinus amylolyticus]
MAVDDAVVQALVREGRHEEAARICAEGGQPARAAELLAAVWKHAEAIRVATDAGLYDEAYRHAVGAQDRELAASLLSSLAARPEQASRAASYAEARGRTSDAARLREAAGELEAAATLHERAGELGDAARCWKELGDVRKAGMLYERRLRDTPDDAESAFELGQILARFGRWDHAARALQIAADREELAIPAGKLLVACFDALGMTDAAQSRLDVLRALEPSMPATVPELLRASFGDERGPRSASRDQLIAGRYRVVRALGAGGTGRVLLAEDAFYGREVAIKVLHAGSSGAAGRDALSRFAREAKVAAGIDHPNVVQVYEYQPDGPFLVMEHMSGGTLEDRLSNGDVATALPASVVQHVGRSVLSALEAVHRRGVVHRDLKPANVFFGRTGEVKLGDFGVAHLADLGATLTGAMMGTLAYMSPEQITGSSRPDASTDLYSLGVIVYRALTGVLPFPGPDFVAQHLELTPARAITHAPWIGEALDTLIASMLEKDPAARPRTASEVLEAWAHLPWAHIEQEAQLAPRSATPVTTRRSSAPPAPPVERWSIVDVKLDGTTIADDELLRRRVVIVPCDADRARSLRALARADSPFLQAVWSIDEEGGRAILELPQGEPARAALDRMRAEEIRIALEGLHAQGLVHGHVDAAHVVVAEGRAVLMLPLGARVGSAAADLEALARLAQR